MGDRVARWALSTDRRDMWRDVLRSVVYAGGGILLIRSFGGWGLLALPLLIPIVWGIEGVALRMLPASSRRDPLHAVSRDDE